MAKNIPDKLIDAQDMLSDFRPYLSGVIYGARMVENENCPSLAADGKWRIHYNREYVERTDIEDLCATIYRNVLSLSYQHAERAESLENKQVVGLSVVMETSSQMSQEGLIEKDAPLPRDFGLRPGLVLEEYYREIMKKLPEQEEQQQQQQSGGQGRSSQQDPSRKHGTNPSQGENGEENAEGPSGEQGQEEEQDQSRSQSAGDQPGSGRESQNSPGSGKQESPSGPSTSAASSGAPGGERREQQGQGEEEAESPEAGSTEEEQTGSSRKNRPELGELPDGKKMPDMGSAMTGEPAPWESKIGEDEGLSKKDAADIIDDMKRNIEKVMKASPSEQRKYLGQGTEPGKVFEEFKNEFEESQSNIPWEQRLASLMVRNLTWARKFHGSPSYAVRSIYQDSVTDGLEKDAIEPILEGRIDGKPKVGVLVDVSGSMDIEKISKAFNEINAILKRSKIQTIALFEGDVRVVSRKTNVGRLSASDLHAGDGGTRLDEVMKEISGDSARPDVLVIFTDADTDWPKKGEIHAGIKVIVGLVNAKEQHISKIPGEYEIVDIDNKPRLDQRPAAGRLKI